VDSAWRIHRTDLQYLAWNLLKNFSIQKDKSRGLEYPVVTKLSASPFQTEAMH